MSALAAVLCPGVPLAVALTRAWWPQPEPPSARAERLRLNSPARPRPGRRDMTGRRRTPGGSNG